MTEQHRGPWTRTSRLIRARPEALYRAFVDPDTLIEWLPPAEMTGGLHWFEARVGGGYRNLPPGLRAEDNDAGARLSLEQLARRFE
jgi:uncharacterized protein YndB with AHSA1/START domain